MCNIISFGLVVAAAVRDLRNDAVPFMAGVVRHITMVAVVQQCGKLLPEFYYDFYHSVQ